MLRCALLLLAPYFTVAAADASLAAVAPPAAAPALKLNLQRHSAGPWEYFYWDTEEGTPVGSVRRDRWRQPLRRHYVAFDATGEQIAEAAQPWFVFRLFFGAQAELFIHATNAQPLGRVLGDYWTLRAANFQVLDGAERCVAKAAVDDYGQSVIFSHPDRPELRLGMLVREQQATEGVDRWQLVVYEQELLDQSAWMLLASFFSDLYPKLRREQTLSS